MDEILLNVETKEMRAAHLKNGQLYNLEVERKKERRLTGNIYRGKVKNILKNIQSAFVDIDEEDNGFVHISDVIENTRKLEDLYEMKFELDENKSQKKASESKSEEKEAQIEEIMKPNQPVLVQVVKEPIGTKGARLTSNISIAGRYLVLLPNTPHRGVSRKIEDSRARDHLKKLIRSFEMPNDMGLICRTASAHAESEKLIDEAHELLNAWHSIREKFENTKSPALLHTESDLIKRSVMTAIDKKYDRLLVDDYAIFQICKRLYKRFGGDHPLRLELYRDKIPMYERFNVEREIEKALKHKIWTQSGGYLFFDRTEAMHTIDVNSGRSSESEGNVEETLVRINLEAAEEIARQLRLRNTGGLIICDFIDMRYRKNRRRVLERLKECMKDDYAKCTILGMSDFGLVEMTRQRSRSSLAQTYYTACPYCDQSGLIKTHESVTIEIERSVKKVIKCQDHFALKLVVHPQLGHYLSCIDKEYLIEMAEGLNARLEFETNDTLHLNDYEIYSTISHERIEI